MSWRSNWPVTGRGPWSSAWASSAPTGCTGGWGAIRCSFERTKPPRWQLRTGPRWDGGGGLEGVLGTGPTQHFIIPAAADADDGPHGQERAGAGHRAGGVGHDHAVVAGIGRLHIIRFEKGGRLRVVCA